MGLYDRYHRYSVQSHCVCSLLFRALGFLPGALVDMYVDCTYGVDAVSTSSPAIYILQHMERSTQQVRSLFPFSCSLQPVLVRG